MVKHKKKNRQNRENEQRSLEELAEEFFEQCEARGLRPATIGRYRYVIRTLRSIDAKTCSPKELTSEKLTKWALEMRKRYKDAGSHIGIAAMFLKWAAWRNTHPEWLQMDYMIPDHLRTLCTMRERNRRGMGEVPVLTPVQVRSLIQTCRDC